MTTVNDLKALIYEIRKFTDDNDKFDSTFLDSIEKQLNEKGFLSPKQVAALEKIYRGFC